MGAKTDDKRRHRRYDVPEHTYAALNSKFMLVGKILNISKGGLAFIYVANGLKICNTFQVDIFFRGNGFCLKEVPFVTVSDFYIENKVPFSTVVIKQCGGQFGELTHSQISQIDYFIENHAICND